MASEPLPVARPAAYALAATRIVLGLIFLWAFLDKTFGLDYSTPSDRSWLNGGEPTRGYLASSFGPFAGVFKDMAGNGLVDALFMFGLLAIGLAMTFGFATRIAGWGGMGMVLLMWLSHPTPWADPHGTHPFLDEHILEAAVFALLALTACGETWGMARRWNAATAKMTWLR